MMIRKMGRGVLLSCCVASATVAMGQTGGAAGKQSLPMFHVNSRVVLTDVTVTDRQGNPVAGLKERDFRIFDDGHAEKLSSFEAHTGKSASGFQTSKEPAGVYSNAGMLHPPAVVNAILLDTTTLGVVDQMYLYEELTKFVKQLPANEPVAIFSRAGEMTLELQGFTSDHAALLTAIRKAIPHLENPGAQYATDYDTLQQMAYYLSQVPGKKNLLWFSGGSSLFLHYNPGASGQGGMTAQQAAMVGSGPGEPDWRQIYDVLEQERIALYPIDARGLVTWVSGQMSSQHLLMAADAEATGGEAMYNTNALAQATERIVATDGDYYTLGYSPNDLHDNGRWHRVMVKLEKAGYRLSYRRGYFDDGKNGTSPTAKTRNILVAKTGKAKQVLNNHTNPIAFTAQVAEISPLAVRDGAIAAPKGGDVPYAVIYRVPVADLTATGVGANHRGTYVVGSGVLAFDHEGTLVKRVGQKLTMTADEREIREKPNGMMKFDQQVNLPRGDDYLYLLVWDSTSGRMGMMNVSLNVKKPGKR